MATQVLRPGFRSTLCERCGETHNKPGGFVITPTGRRFCSRCVTKEMLRLYAQLGQLEAEKDLLQWLLAFKGARQEDDGTWVPMEVDQVAEAVESVEQLVVLQDNGPEGVAAQA